MMEADIVVGLGFGDEGKGKTVDYIATISYNSSLLNVKFNGGPNAGHNVKYGDNTFTFTQFGSATLRNVPTLVSRYCCFSPEAYVEEREKIHGIWSGINSLRYYIDIRCPIVTPFDVMANINDKENLKDGTVGTGLGKTFKRHNESKYKLVAADLWAPHHVFLTKLYAIGMEYYGYHEDMVVSIITEFMKTVAAVRSTAELCTDVKIIREYDQIIFEGNQGFYLDQTFGTIPNVTYSNTTIQNAMALIKECDGLEELRLHYVTRTYITRHGNGSFPYLPIEVEGKHEVNEQDDYQGEFKRGKLSLDTLKHAIYINSEFTYNLSCADEETLYVNCADEYDENLNSIHELAFSLGLVFRVSDTPCSEYYSIENYLEWKNQEKEQV